MPKDKKDLESGSDSEKSKAASASESEAEEEYIVEKVVDKRFTKSGKVCLQLCCCYARPQTNIFCLLQLD